MINNEDITQEEIDKFGIDDSIKINVDIKNIVILFRNELNTLEKEIDKYPDDLQQKIKEKLNNLLQYILHIRKNI